MGVERGIVLLREGVPLYEDLRKTPSDQRLRGERPTEPKWLDYEVLGDLRDSAGSVPSDARPSVVAPGEVSPSAQDKARRKRTASGERVHSFRTLLDDLATVANSRVVAPLADAKPFDLITRPTALQRKAFKLLGVRLERTQ